MSSLPHERNKAAGVFRAVTRTTRKGANPSRLQISALGLANGSNTLSAYTLVCRRSLEHTLESFCVSYK